MMSLSASKYYFGFLIGLVTVISQACNATPKPVSSTPTLLFAQTLLPSGSIAPSKVTPSAIAAPTLSLTPTAMPVIVTAVKGNLFIRRGPDLAFNPLSVLKDGQSATAIARDVLASWLQIPIPGQSDVTGWVSIQSHFSVVSGDVMNLPEYNQTDWPVAASLRNCTHHQLEADPGGIVLPPVDNFPDNEVRINPGTYTVIDTDVAGAPDVGRVVIKEGSAIDVLIDGNGEHRKCPIP